MMRRKANEAIDTLFCFTQKSAKKKNYTMTSKYLNSLLIPVFTNQS